MAFEKFIPPRRQKPPQVSIKKTGTIAFDVALAAVYGLTKASHVLLFFDPARKLVGVRPARDPKDEGAMKLTHRKRVSSVRARSFFEAYGIKLERTSRYAVSEEKNGGMAVIDLGEVKRRRGLRERRP